jgi:hypothetical protein
MMIPNLLRGLVSRIEQPAGQFWFWVTQRFTTCGKTQATCRSSGGHDFSRAAHAAKTLLAVVVASGALLTAQGPRFLLAPITRDEVWQAVILELRQRGVREEQMLRPEEIDLPVAIMAAASHTLRVSMVCWDADLGRAQFQMECRQAGQCVPFLAYADAGRSTAMGSERIAGSSCRAASRARSELSVPHKAVIRVGDRATVVFRGSQLSLTALVTCLERGAEGEIIRVRNQDGQIFRARVSAPARLEALP